MSSSCERAMGELPEDVITDILIRLPVKSLLQFRCVSKPFCGQIDNPKFIKQHLSRSLKTNHTLLLQDRYDLYSANLNSLDQTQKLNHPLKSDKKKTVMVGSANGLVCLSNSEKDFAIWNFATRTYQKLPIPSLVFLSPPNDFAHQYNYGFGYKSVSDDYKLLRIVQFYSPNFESFETEAKVCSLRSKSWERIKNFPFLFSCKRVRPFQLACGALHWIVSLTYKSDSNLIASFDLYSNEYMLLDQPDIQKKGRDVTLGELGGKLCMMCNYDDEYVDVWVMRNYGVRKSWTKLFSVSQSNDINPLAYSKKGDEILFVEEYKALIWYNMEEGKKRMVQLRGCPERFHSAICVESLVYLSGKAEDYAKKRDGEAGNKQIKSRKKRDDFLSQGFKLVL